MGIITDRDLVVHGIARGLPLDGRIVAFAEEFAEITRGVAWQLVFPKAGDPAEPPVRAAATSR